MVSVQLGRKTLIICLPYCLLRRVVSGLGHSNTCWPVSSGYLHVRFEVISQDWLYTIYLSSPTACGNTSCRIIIAWFEATLRSCINCKASHYAFSTSDRQLLE
ncbi:uncharacterized protein BCR38DRAFT_434221 [Pseudomassariella vexata]|uniref:Secreted protein n=1 Tax=Pseudomassariella vexata TaxID=1141098 RepID=A0A1Y2DYL0_9PEZI|nr:uncharacterized protein BCR38DRAFT_434221 [Pseudomassariella vexata]ORY64174.1 hypothetical protein BCR38DRAFT_434221 [Pseudomassariella vexata]